MRVNPDPVQSLRTAGLRGSAAVSLILLAAACAGSRGPAGPEAPEPGAPTGPPAAETPREPAAAETPPSAPALAPPSGPVSLLDDGDPESLRTAVGRSLRYLEGVAPETPLDFGVRQVPAGALRSSLEELHAFLAGGPSAPELEAWVRARFDVVESVGGDDGDVLFTGYFEPVIPGAPERTERAGVPVYGVPDDLVRVPLRDFDAELPARTLTGRVEDGRVVPYFTRAEIQDRGALQGRGLEIAWVEDRVDLFFVEVQGSGAIRFPDGRELGIGVGASNGRPYRSIGRVLIEEGRVPEDRMSMQAIREYLDRHPEEIPRVLNQNPSFIFFRTRDTPPIGSLGQPVTTERSIATDSRIFPRGALAFIATSRPAVDAEGRVAAGPPYRRFMLNQDTGGAIRGAGRVDVFWGRGDHAAETAGRMQHGGRLLFLVPRLDAGAPGTPAAPGRAETPAPAAAGARDETGARRPGSPTSGEGGRLRVVVLGDLNSSYGSTEYEPQVHAVVRRIADDWRPDLVLLTGDVIAGQRAELPDQRVRSMWAAFDEAVMSPLRGAGIPVAFTPGNHDASGHPAHARDRRLAEEYWRGRDTGIRLVAGGRFPFRYAFSHGDAFFVVLDASTGGVAADTAQLEWLRRTLASDAARDAGVRVSLGHVPLYAVAEGRSRPGEVQAAADSLRRVLERAGVRLHASGHHHAYFPGRRGGLAFLHAGALGQGPRPLLGGDGASPRTVTVLDLFPTADSVAERTYRVGGDSLVPVDPRRLPARLDGITGPVYRRDVLTVVSYNIHAGKDAEGRDNLERVAMLLDSVGADLALLQEVDRGTRRSGGVDQLQVLQDLTGMHGAFGRIIDYQGGLYGVALLSRWPIRSTEVVPLPASPPERRSDGSYEPRVALLAEVAVPGEPLTVLNTHLGPEANGVYRRQELVALLGEIHRRTGRTGRLVAGGDYNARPTTHEILAATLALDDAFATCGDGPGETYPADAPDRRIDYVLYRDLRCVAARVPATTASDHRPLVVQLEEEP